MEVPEGLKERQKSVLEHKQEIKGKPEAFIRVKVQPIVCSFYKMIANMMTFANANLRKINIYIKKYLNKFNTINILIKKKGD